MIVLLTGASGFLGRHLAPALRAAGHQVICAVRRPKQATDRHYFYVAADFTRDFDASVWLPRLDGVDAVINAVGIIREQGAQTFEAIHVRAPQALFSACAAAGVRRVVQISALGADRHAASRYHLSKRKADDFLASLPLASTIVQPSLIYGSDGASARLFTMLASLPVIGLPGSGAQAVQPVHVDDVVAAIVALLAGDPAPGARVSVVGPEAMSLRDFLAALRQGMGLGRARFLPLSMPLMRLAAAAGKHVPGVLLDPETLQMLERGNIADAAPMHALLGRPPRPAREFIAASEAPAVRVQARLNWLMPMLRWSIALVWIVTGIVSLGLYPVADSYALLARVGITGAAAPPMLFGAAAMDLALGVATLAMKRRTWLWRAQAAVILFYTVLISWRLPEFWLHPYGPLLKNLPMLAAIWVLAELEER